MKQVLVHPSGNGGAGTGTLIQLSDPHGGVVAITAENVARGTTVDMAPVPATITEVSLANWRDVAACRDTDPDLFFPVGTTGPAVDQISAAKIVCDTCPAKQPCLEFALLTNQDSGVWGGTSEDERRKLRRAWVKSRRAAS